MHDPMTVAHEGYYQVSNFGRVRSVKRLLVRSSWVASLVKRKLTRNFMTLTYNTIISHLGNCKIMVDFRR